MTGGREAAPLPAGLEVLAYRLAGSVLLLGGGALLVALLAVLSLPYESLPGRAGYGVPGTAGRALIAPVVVPVLGASGGAMAVLGLLLLGAARWRAGRPALLLRLQRRRPAWRATAILAGGITLLVVALLRR